jgi:CheY-like chemotaxis protein
MLATTELMPVAIVAESDEETRGLIRSLLELLGFAVVEANDGEDVYRSAVCYHPHLILMELQPPAVNDVAAIRRIRCDSDLSKVPIIVTSANRKKTNQRLAFAAGCTAHLPKPIEFENLVPCDRLSLVSFLVH